jgi:ATP synthase I chain
MKKTDEEQGNAPEEPLGPPPDPDSPAEQFYGAAVSRILRTTLIVSLIAVVVALAIRGVRPALGVLIGSGLAYWNFRYLASSVNSLGERIVVGHSRESGGSIVFRFISRILLVGLAGYAIFLSSPGSLSGFLVGLCMPVPALMWEAAYEGFTALRRGL